MRPKQPKQRSASSIIVSSPLSSAKKGGIINNNGGTSYCSRNRVLILFLFLLILLQFTIFQNLYIVAKENQDESHITIPSPNIDRDFESNSPPEAHQQQQQQQRLTTSTSIHPSLSTIDSTSNLHQTRGTKTAQFESQPQQSSTKNGKKKPYLIIHMGPDKTGTTTIQKYLNENQRQLLEVDNIDVRLSRGIEDDDEASISSKANRPSRLTSYFMKCWLPPKKVGRKKLGCSPNYWNDRLEQLKSLAYNHTDTPTNLLLSTEDFRWSTSLALSSDTSTTTSFGSFINSLNQYFQIRIVLVYRRYFEWLPSRYNQEWKSDGGPDSIRVLKWPGIEEGEIVPSFSDFYEYERNRICTHKKIDCNVYFANRFDNITKTLTHPVLAMKQTMLKKDSNEKVQNNVNNDVDIRIINLHEKNLLESFVCDGMSPIATKTCGEVKKLAIETTSASSATPSSSTSSSNLSGDHIHFDTIATAAYMKGLVNKNLARNAVKGKIKEYIVNHIMTTEQPTDPGKGSVLDYLPIKCLSQDSLQEFQNASYRFELELQPDLVKTHDQSFDVAVQAHKFCNVDTDKLVDDENWISFFHSLDANGDNASDLASTTTGANPNKNATSTLPYLIIHMGPDKTGTTSIQEFLVKNRKVLESDKIDATMSRGTKDKWLNEKLSFFTGVLIEARKGNGAYSRKEKLKTKFDERLQTIVDLSDGGTKHVILSTEELRWAKFWSRDWYYVLTTLQKHFKICIVLVYRRYFEWLPSRYHEEWRVQGPEGRKVMEWPLNEEEGEKGPGQYTPTFAQFYEWERTGTCVRQKLKCSVYFQHRFESQPLGPKFMTHPTLAMKKWLETGDVVPNEVKVINFHSDNLLEEFFCYGLPNAPESCQKAKTITKLKNPSKEEINYDLIALAAHKQGLIYDGVSRNQAKSKSKVFLANVLNQSISDLPNLCLGDDGEGGPQMLLEEFRNISYHAERILQPSLVDGHDEAFDKYAAKKKFCNVDGHKLLLQNEHWKKYMSVLRVNK